MNINHTSSRLSNNFIHGLLLILQKTISYDTYMPITRSRRVKPLSAILDKTSMTDFSKLTHADINWQQLWKNARQLKGWASKGASDWDKKAASFSSRNRTSPYNDLILSHLPLTPEMTVLDIGCGPGTLSLPIAKRVQSVTALDFSQNMLGILQTDAKKRHLNNIETYRCAWEDDWSSLGIKPHDIAIASRSLSVDNLQKAITQLNTFATKYVFIADRISPTPFDPEVFSAVGRDFNSGPDYIYTLNILYSLGIHPNVTILELDPEFYYQDLDQAYLTYSWMIKELTVQEEDKLKNYIKTKARTTADGRISIYRKSPPRWALIWWAQKADDSDVGY